MPFNRPTLTELVDRVRDDFDARMPGADSRLRRSALDVFGRVFAGGLHNVYGLLDWLSRQILPDTAESEWLNRHTADWGIIRKAATPATGVATVTGVNGSIVPLDAILARRDGVEYKVTAATTIVGGTAAVPIEAVIAGDAGNADAATQMSFAAPVGGVNAQAVAAAVITGGNEEEGDDALRSRLLLRIQRPPHGGNANDYIAWALEVSGVTRAWVYPNELGLGTVTVRFVMDDRVDIIPLAPDVAAVQAYVNVLRPVTAALTVIAPVPEPLDFVISCNPATLAVRTAIKEELTDLLRREAEPGGTILESHMREAISIAAGEFDHEMIQPTTDVVSGAGALSVIGLVTFV